MAKDLDRALQEVEMTYGQVKQIADEMLAPTFEPINQLVTEISTMIQDLSIDSIRYYLLKMQLSAFSLSELKDRASIKAECAEALKKKLMLQVILYKKVQQQLETQMLLWLSLKIL